LYGYIERIGRCQAIVNASFDITIDVEGVGMPLGDRIKELRIRKNKSLQEVADAIGASKAHIWELESNRSKNPSLDLLKKLAGYFNTTVAFLIDEQAAQGQAEMFFRRNSDKLGSLEEEQFKVLEDLLNVIAKKK
jgi:transcriptional regulator with XRE-family HTH domain